MEGAVADSPHDGVGMSTLPLVRLADLGDQFVDVPGRLIERVLSFELSSERDLEQLRRGQAPLLELRMEIVGEVHLHAWHALNYTPIRVGTPAHNAVN